jgi:hypothetical protein
MKRDIEGCIFTMCRGFTCEVVGQRGRLEAVQRGCGSGIECHFVF